MPLLAPRLPSSLSTKAPAAPTHLCFLIRAECRLTRLFRVSLHRLLATLNFPQSLGGSFWFLPLLNTSEF